MTIIYDVGANAGENIPYYLLKSDKVVAVEANPAMCEVMRMRFGTELAQGRLVIENVVVASSEDTGKQVSFYRHRTNSQLSQFKTPDDLESFEELELPAKGLPQIIDLHGDPYYIKIDIEHLDWAILKDLFGHEIFPPYLSAEAHDPAVLGLLIACGRYPAFKIVDGAGVSRRYRDHLIRDARGEMQRISFPFHSAGPFGEDVEGPWFSIGDFLRVIAQIGLGWRDIHVSRFDAPATISFKSMEARLLKLQMRKYLVALKLLLRMY